MKKALFIVGPTGIGKTDLAYFLASKFPSKIISADSIQVYKGLDIISGKDIPQGSKFIKDHYVVDSTSIYLLDLVSPSDLFSVHNFVKTVEPIVKKTIQSKKLLIIVGGTGFYTDALTRKIETISIPRNTSLRGKLEHLSIEELQKKLNNVDSARFKKMNHSDVRNKRRLIRAIEIALFRGSTPIGVEPLLRDDEVLIIGLKTSLDNLKERIKKRVEGRIKMGALNEVRKLFRNYKNLSPQVKTASGYRQLFDYLFRKTSLDEAKKNWVVSDYRLAKKQMTWFKRNKNIIWFDIKKKGFENQISKLINQHFPL